MEQAKSHPRKNLITRALGVEENIKIDYCEYDMSENEVILLCTDGLTNYVENAEFSEVIKNNSYYEIADLLVNMANENGGGDNITVVAISY